VGLSTASALALATIFQGRHRSITMKRIRVCYQVHDYRNNISGGYRGSRRESNEYYI
jgi:hypothetical protein